MGPTTQDAHVNMKTISYKSDMHSANIFGNSFFPNPNKRVKLSVQALGQH